MGLADIVRSGISTIDGITKSLQVPVVHEAWIGQLDSYARPKFATPIVRMMLVEPDNSLKMIKDGQEVVQRFQLTHIGPIAPNGTPDRTEPIDPRDRFTLPDGSYGLVMRVNGLTDPNTNRPYMYEVAVG